MNTDVTELVSLSSRVLGAAGHGDLIWGHSSARDPQGRGVWIKQASWGMEEVTPELVQLVTREGDVLEGAGPRHSEYPIHTEIMAALPDVGGVVHTHSRYAVALAASGQDLKPVSHEANYFVPPVVPRFTETADLILTADLGRRVVSCLGGARAIFLVNHGIVTVGPDLQTATVAAILLDRACHLQILTTMSGTFPTWSDPGEAASKREHIYGGGSMHNVWDYLVRGLPRAP